MLAHAVARVADRDQTRLLTREQLMQTNSMAATNSPTVCAPGQDSPIPVVMLSFERASEREADWLAARAV
jgi:hypothetical protein